MASTRSAATGTSHRRRGLLLGLGLAAAVRNSAAVDAQRVELYTPYPDAPLDARSPGNLTQKLASWLSARSAGRYRFVASQRSRLELDELVARPGWQGAVAWVNPRWFDDVARQRFLWTRAFMQDTDLVVSNRRRPVEFLDEGRSLEGLRVGSLTGHRLVDLDWLIERGRLRRVDAARELDLLTELGAGRLDVALVQAISLPALRRALPGLDDWLHIARQPRDTFGRHLFTAPGDSALRDFLDLQLTRLQQDPAWRQELPQQPRQLRLLAIDRLDSPYALALRRLLDLVFERAGLHYSLSALPAERGFVELSAGRFDGDIGRHAGFAQQLLGALRVEPAHSRILQLALVRRGGETLQGWEDLRPLRFALPRGFKAGEQLTLSFQGRQLVEGADACVRMVESGRVHACVLPGFTSAELVGREAGRGLDAHVLGHADVHLWLRPGLEAEARRLSEALNALAREGELQRLMGAYRAPAAP